MDYSIRHEPLPDPNRHIRLLRLELTGSKHFYIEHFDLEEAPDYVAISYRWGQREDRGVQIYINDEIVSLQFTIFRLLKKIEWARLSDYFWIDQLCIDQKNIKERSCQVGQMAEIFSRASEVMIWLDDARVYSRAIQVSSFPGARGILLETMDAIASHEYWSRLWVAQEIMLAKGIRLICESGTISWHELLLAYDHYKATNDLLGFEKFRHFRWFMEEKRDSNASEVLSPHKLISIFCTSGCTDPRDKIYGMRGMLIKSGQGMILDVNYSKTYGQVFLDAVKMILQDWDGQQKSDFEDRLFTCFELAGQMFPTRFMLSNVFRRLGVLEPFTAPEDGFRTEGEETTTSLSKANQRLVDKAVYEFGQLVLDRH